MARNSFTHSPDEYLDCGVLGEFPVQFTAAIDSEKNRFGWSHKATIVAVKITVDNREVDITMIFKRNLALVDTWQAVIESAYRNMFFRGDDYYYEDQRDRKDGA